MKEKNVRSDAVLFTFFIRCQEANLLILEIKKQRTQDQGDILHHYFTWLYIRYFP